MPIATSVTPAAANTLASVERTSNSSAASRWPESAAPAAPTASPARIGTMPSRKTICTNWPGVAPSAERMPISFSRRTIACDATPYTPILISNNATTAKHASNDADAHQFGHFYDRRDRQVRIHRLNFARHGTAEQGAVSRAANQHAHQPSRRLVPTRLVQAGVNVRNILFIQAGQLHVANHAHHR